MADGTRGTSSSSSSSRAGNINKATWSAVVVVVGLALAFGAIAQTADTQTFQQQQFGRPQQFKSVAYPHWPRDQKQQKQQQQVQQVGHSNQQQHYRVQPQPQAWRVKYQATPGRVAKQQQQQPIDFVNRQHAPGGSSPSAVQLARGSPGARLFQVDRKSNQLVRLLPGLLDETLLDKGAFLFGAKQVEFNTLKVLGNVYVKRVNGQKLRDTYLLREDLAPVGKKARNNNNTSEAKPQTKAGQQLVRVPVKLRPPGGAPNKRQLTGSGDVQKAHKLAGDKIVSPETTTTNKTTTTTTTTTVNVEPTATTTTTTTTADSKTNGTKLDAELALPGKGETKRKKGLLGDGGESKLQATTTKDTFSGAKSANVQASAQLTTTKSQTQTQTETNGDEGKELKRLSPADNSNGQSQVEATNKDKKEAPLKGDEKMFEVTKTSSGL